MVRPTIECGCSPPLVNNIQVWVTTVTSNRIWMHWHFYTKILRCGSPPLLITNNQHGDISALVPRGFSPPSNIISLCTVTFLIKNTSSIANNKCPIHQPKQCQQKFHHFRPIHWRMTPFKPLRYLLCVTNKSWKSPEISLKFVNTMRNTLTFWSRNK